jgi:hypothetical protein
VCVLQTPGEEAGMSASFTAKTIVWIHVRDRNRSGHAKPIGRLLTWMLDEHIYSAVTGGYTAPWGHAAGYSPSDAVRIVEWMEKNGVGIELEEDA